MPASYIPFVRILCVSGTDAAAVIQDCSTSAGPDHYQCWRLHLEVAHLKCRAELVVGEVVWPYTFEVVTKVKDSTAGTVSLFNKRPP
jgi:hypothetical protein